MSKKAITDYEKMVAASVAHAVRELSAGAVVRLESDGWPRLERNCIAQPDGRAMDELFHCGWLESMANGGTFKLSEAGQLAFDKWQAGEQLVAPNEWQN